MQSVEGYVSNVVAKAPLKDKKAIASLITSILVSYGASSVEDTDTPLLYQLVAKAVVGGAPALKQHVASRKITLSRKAKGKSKKERQTDDVFDMPKRRKVLEKLKMVDLRDMGGKGNKKGDLVTAVLEIERKAASQIPALMFGDKSGSQREAYWNLEEWEYSAYVDDLRKAELRGRPIVEEGPFKCKRCKSERIVMRSKYGASGDEMVRVEMICMGCGNRW